MTTTIQMIAVDSIEPHPHNPRRDLGDLSELADSIKAQGIRQNLLVVPLGTGRFGDRYRAVIGHRRLAAAKLAKVDEVPAVVDVDLTDAEQLELMLLENVQRQDLSPIEEAEAYQELLDLGVKVREICKRTGRKESTVTARLRLMKLPEDSRELVHLGQATLEDAADVAALAGHPDLMARAASYLGTNNFKWQLSEVRAQARRDEKRKPLLAWLAKLGVTEITSAEEAGGRASLGAVEDTTQAGELLAKYSDVDVDTLRYRVVEWQDAIFIAKLTPRDVEADAARAVERQEAEEERARLIAEGDALYAVRDEWVRAYVARKRIPAKDQLAIVAAAAPLVLLVQLGLGRYQIGNFLLPNHQPGADTEEALVQALADQFPAIDPASMLLLALHLGAGTLWSDAYRWPRYAALYALLEQLGYPVSDAERARLTPDDDEDEEPEE